MTGDRPLKGTIALELSEEFPRLSLLYLVVPGGTGRSGRELRARLAELSDRFRVAHAPALRQGEIPQAYRSFYRQVGLDPDVTRSPVDTAIMERLVVGRFKPRNRVEDAVTLAAMEMQVPVWALDGEGITGGLGIRTAHESETLEAGGEPLGPGQLVVADANRAITALLAPPPESRRVTRDSAATLLYTVRVEGVNVLVAEEALHQCGLLMLDR